MTYILYTRLGIGGRIIVLEQSLISQKGLPDTSLSSTFDTEIDSALKDIEIDYFGERKE